MLRIIFVIFWLKCVLSFKSSDVCWRLETECKESSAELACPKSKCTGHYDYQCGEDNCAVTMKICEQFRALNKNSLRMLISPASYHAAMRNYEAFSSNIKNCSQNDYVFKHKDVCLRDHANLNSFHNACEFESVRKLKCGKFLCVAHENTCNSLRHLLKKYPNDIWTFKRCHHLF